MRSSRWKKFQHSVGMETLTSACAIFSPAYRTSLMSFKSFHNVLNELFSYLHSKSRVYINFLKYHRMRKLELTRTLQYIAPNFVTSYWEIAVSTSGIPDLFRLIVPWLWPLGVYCANCRRFILTFTFYLFSQLFSSPKREAGCLIEWDQLAQLFLFSTGIEIASVRSNS